MFHVKHYNYNKIKIKKNEKKELSFQNIVVHP